MARRAAGAGAGVMFIRIRIDDEMDFRNVGESRSVIRFCCGEGECGTCCSEHNQLTKPLVFARTRLWPPTYTWYVLIRTEAVAEIPLRCDGSSRRILAYKHSHPIANHPYAHTY